MEKLDNNEIDVAKASAMSKLVCQTNNVLMHELKRAVVLSNPDYAAKYREIELSNINAAQEPDELPITLKGLGLDREIKRKK
jgi:hypothetical protein